ncbi:EamA family transporter [Acidihalobacter yilgarnensis]|uniref:EamA family transporter n=1 Tax=Acidihalobacter yilgarnensis TaxID=2819280 RepID=UPI001E407E6E|nr:EamA family transporter [Acidihalobacter yilgarnensis]
MAAGLGAVGVLLLILAPQASLNPLGIVAGLIGAASMAAGTVLSRRWQPSVSLLTFTAWQLTAGGVLLLPFALWQGTQLTQLSATNLGGLAYLSLIGAAMTYLLWFRGLSRLSPIVVSALGFFSPLTAVLLGWAILGQTLSVLQIVGMALVLGGVWLSQHTDALQAFVLPKVPGL